MEPKTQAGFPKWLKNIFNHFDNFFKLSKTIFDILNPFLPLFILIGIPLFLLGGTSQGREIIVIILDRFSELSDSYDKMWTYLLIFFVCSFFSFFNLLHAIIILHFKSSSLDQEEDPCKKTISSLSIPYLILISLSTAALGIGLSVIFITSGIGTAKWLFASACFIPPIGSLTYFLSHFRKGEITNIFYSIYHCDDAGRSKLNQIYFYFPTVFIIAAVVYFFNLQFPFVGKWFFILFLVSIVVAILLFVLKIIDKRNEARYASVRARVTELNSFLLTVSFLIAYSGYLSSSLTSILLGFSFISLLILKLDYYRLKKGYPLFIVALLFLVVMGVFRRDGEVRMTEQPENIETITVNENYENWLAQKGYHQAKDSIPIYIISSEGGGIRSAFWTTGLLIKLDSLFPDLMNKTYAFSGVSGGSVGEMFYLAMRRDSLHENWPKILGADYLAGALAGLTIGEAFQSVLPFSWSKLNRANVLEDDWSKEYNKQTGKNTLDMSLHSFYQNSGYSQPNLFFNATQVESGKKAIVSNLKLGENFEGDIDLLETVNKTISLKSAALLSARFPGISPTALVTDETDKDWGKIVDGGYYDNSGLMTALHIVRIIQESSDSVKIKPVILFIRNANTASRQSSGVSSELTAPVNAFYQSWTAKTEQTIRDMSWLSKKLNFQFIQLELSYEAEGRESIYPLGWTLSSYSQKLILSQLEAIGNNRDALNYNALSTLKELEK